MLAGKHNARSTVVLKLDEHFMLLKQTLFCQKDKAGVGCTVDFVTSSSTCTGN